MITFQERLSSEKLTAILGEFDRVDELSEVQFCLGVAANLLLTAKQPDPELYLAHYVETDLRLRPGLYSRTVCIMSLLNFTDEERFRHSDKIIEEIVIN